MTRGKIVELSRDGIINICSAEATSDELKVIETVGKYSSGTLNEKEILALNRLCTMLPEGAKILEIGSFRGASAAAMGHAILGRNISLFCIDMWANYLEQEDFADFDENLVCNHLDVIQDFMENTDFLGEQLKMMKGRSSDFADMIAGQNFDLIFVDGAHDYESVRADILMCMKALSPDGLLTGHDFHTAAHGVRQAVNELVGYVSSIEVKGTIDETFIWFARIDQPEYEVALTEISDTHNNGDTVKALDMAMSALKRYKTDELLEITAILKTKLFSGA